MANLSASAMIIALLMAAMTVWHLLDRPISEVRVEGRLNPAEQNQVRESLAGRFQPGDPLWSDAVYQRPHRRRRRRRAPRRG